MTTTNLLQHYASRFMGLALSAVLVTVSLQAQTSPASSEPSPRVAIGMNVGTYGFGPAVLFTFNRHFTANLGYTYLSYNFDYDAAEYTVTNASTKFSNIQAMINWHPMAGNFRFSVGFFSANNKASGNIKTNSADGYRFNHHDYLNSEIRSVDYNVELKKGVAPYIGLGWSKTPDKKGWGFFGDIGVLLGKSPSTKITPYTTAAITPAKAAQLRTDVLADEATANDDLSFFKYYPIIQGGVMYRF